MEKSLFGILSKFEIRLEFLSTVGAGHEHSANILGKPELLSAFLALLNCMFGHKIISWGVWLSTALINSSSRYKIEGNDATSLLSKNPKASI